MHGRVALKIQERIQNKTVNQILNKCHKIKYDLLEYCPPEMTDLLQILSVRKEKYWSQEEHTSLQEAIKIHGLNYSKIQLLIPSKTRI